jgi:RNA polymerase sigma-54 factor
MIEREDRPLSDSEIKEKLEEDGVSIARRTVAKYRSMEGILPAHLRSNAKLSRLICGPIHPWQFE